MATPLNTVEITEHLARGAVILEVRGRLDMPAAEAFRQRLDPFVSSASARGDAVVLDFSGVDYISSGGERVLLLAYREMQAAGRQMAMASVQPVVREILEISRFDKLLPCYPTVDTALAAVTRSPASTPGARGAD